MKQGINFLLPIQVGMDVNLIDSMEFIFKQGEKEMNFTYPSEKAIKQNDNTISLVWTKEETYYFNSANIQIDTRITLKDSQYQPETKIANVFMKPTLFHKESGE